MKVGDMLSVSGGCLAILTDMQQWTIRPGRYKRRWQVVYLEAINRLGFGRAIELEAEWFEDQTIKSMSKLFAETE